MSFLFSYSDVPITKAETVFSYLQIVKLGKIILSTCRAKLEKKMTYTFLAKLLVREEFWPTFYSFPFAL